MIDFQASAQQAWERTLMDLLAAGKTFGATRPGIEILGYTVGLTDIRNRVGGHPRRPLAIVPAVARFVWMMAGSDRLADIAFYEPKVKHFTDDGVSVPGSNYGARLRRAAPGLDQVAEAVARLAPDPDRPDNHLRRAVNVIWRAEDAARDSKDIPCAFGIGYFPREQRLHTELVMRSNNSMLLMPFNLFEFSLLSEVVATSAGIEPGPLLLHAMSMHLYDGEKERKVAERVVAEPANGLMAPMPPMPRDDPLGQIKILVQCEVALRHSGAAVAHHPVAELRARGASLVAYWRAFFEVLLVHHLVAAERYDDARHVADALPNWARDSARRHIIDRAPVANGAPEHPESLFDVSQLADTAVVDARTAQVHAALRNDADDHLRAHIHALLDTIELEANLSHADAHRVVDYVLATPVVGRRSAAYANITVDDVRSALQTLGFR